MQKHPDRPTFSSVLSNGAFLMLWIGQLLSQLADRVFIYALMIIAYSLTRSNLGVAVPLLSFGIPSLLFGSFAGVFADRMDRKGIMIVSAIMRGLLILLIVPLVGKSMVAIFLVSFFIYTAAQFFAPAESSSIPELVQKKDLIVANSLFMITWVSASMLGFGLGAPLVSYLEEKGTFVVAAVLYFFAAGAIFLVPLKYKDSRKRELKFSFFTDFVTGLEFLRRKFVVNFAIITSFVATSAIAIVSLLAISYAKDVLHIGERNFGYLIIFLGLGMLLGLGILERLSHYLKKGVLVTTGFILSGTILAVIANISDLRWALGLTFLLGVCNIVLTSSIQTILQQSVPRKIMGRVFGVQNMMINSAFVFPVIIWGGIADLWGITTAFSLLGGMLFLTGIATLFVPKFRSL
jgi:MFS family permease